MTPRVSPDVSPFQNRPVREMVGFHSELCLFIRLYLSLIASGVLHPLECELQ